MGQTSSRKLEQENRILDALQALTSELPELDSIVSSDWRRREAITNEITAATRRLAVMAERLYPEGQRTEYRVISSVSEFLLRFPEEVPGLSEISGSSRAGLRDNLLLALRRIESMEELLSKSITIPDEKPSAADFDFDLADAVTEDLVARFSALSRAPLTMAEVERVRPKQGVYHLYHLGHGQELLVYVGQAGDLCGRLSDHLRNLTARKNIDVKHMAFKCLYIGTAWIPVTHEEQLLRYYEKHHHVTPAWNGQGFGNHDPGRQRERTAKKSDGFYVRYPVREDYELVEIEPGEWNIHDLLRRMKTLTPFVFRYETDSPQAWSKGSDKYNHLIVNVSPDDRTFIRMLSKVVRELKGKWQGVIFPSHAILYEDHPTRYDTAYFYVKPSGVEDVRPQGAGEDLFPMPMAPGEDG